MKVEGRKGKGFGGTVGIITGLDGGRVPSLLLLSSSANYAISFSFLSVLFLWSLYLL